jgi:hypothetical protein
VRPSKLYIAADGPREHRPDDIRLCEETRRTATAVDWPCSIQTLFRPRNLGCRLAVSTALDWFFEQEEHGIILEEDCVPSLSFFSYCGELLKRFAADERIMAVSGANFQNGREVTPYSYYFSRYMHCWGWATWRRAWQLCDREMSLWPEFRDSAALNSWGAGESNFVAYWQNIFDAAAAGKIDSWAYRFLFSCWAHNGLTCIPRVNLVSNIGGGADATHTSDPSDWLLSITARELRFPLNHPPGICRNWHADRFVQEYVFAAATGPTRRARLRHAVARVLPAPVKNALRRVRAQARP